MSNKKPPPPTGIEPPPPERPPSKFRFHKPLRKPKKLAKPPGAKDEFLHILCMSVLGILFFGGGAIYMAIRAAGSRRLEINGTTLIVGGLLGIGIFYEACKRFK